MPQTPAVLAVDGGNSKADLALVSGAGEVLAAARVPGFSHQTVGVERAAAGLAAAVAGLRSAVGLDPGVPVAEVGAFCLAGADLPVDDDVLGAILREGGHTRRAVLRNDVFAVLRAGSEGGAGVAVVCGAGMNGVGVDDHGRAVRYPALGEISGDLAAGGGWLGVRALGAAVRADDGRGPATVLEELVPAHFGLLEPLHVTEAVYTGKIDEGELRGLAPLVLRCAAEGDAVAGELVAAVADEIVALIHATMARLDLLDRAVPVVLGGGVFCSADRVLETRVTDAVARFAPQATIRSLATPPVVGAALLGLDDHLGGAGPSREVTERVERELTAVGLGADVC